MDNPFALFPLEVWEMILDRVYDSDTAYNVLQIYPELNEAFQNKKHEWIIGKVLPFITTWTNMLEGWELLNCRQVCKNWLKQVDTFVENQPKLRPYDPKLHTEDHYNLNLTTLFRRKNPFIGSKKMHFGGVVFDIDDKNDQLEEKFLKDFESYPENRNPFLARQLSLITRIDYDERSGRLEEFLENSAKIMERFGHHIWFFSVKLHAQHRFNKFQICQWLTQSLSLLPNLKSLTVRIYDVWDCDFNKTAKDIHNETNSLKIYESELVPINLQSLESIHLSPNVPRVFVCRLLNSITITTPIRRIVTYYDSWIDEYSRLFASVTEFKIHGIWIKEDDDVIRLRKFLLSLEAPKLVKLELDIISLASKQKLPINQNVIPWWVNENAIPRFSLEGDVYTWIKHFPSLKYLYGGSGSSSDMIIQEKGTLAPDYDSMPSLKFLSISDNYALSYNFLRCLPSLRHIKIHTNIHPTVVDLSSEKVVSIRNQIETGTMHKSNVWALLPNLKSVSILTHNSGNYYCNREMVSYFMKYPNSCEFARDYREEIATSVLINQHFYENENNNLVPNDLATSSDSDHDDDDYSSNSETD